ncbi:MAG TPA: methylenetetrahydrofolate reductase [Stellaceae bacterium]|jgi:methylenetetrahydrofolate reductase (NADPH)|nr:methylenetetrahydrofolate reductase [Stellaceae bacterium]
MMAAAGAAAISSFQQLLASGRFAVTAELVPPVSTDPAAVLARALPLRRCVAAVNVTDGAGARAHVAGLVAARILIDNGIEPILQMACRDRNRLALESDLLGALALGVRNLLVLTGDDPKSGDQPEAKPVFDLDSRALLALAHRLSREGRLPPDTPVDGATSLFLGAADVPIDPPPGWAPTALAAKAAAGARFVQTQFCFDMGVARRYAARLAEHGLGERIKLLIGIAPLPSARSARWMREKLAGSIVPDAVIARLERAADPRREGIRLCAELLQELATIPGIAGAHVMAPQNPAAIPEAIAAAGLGVDRIVPPPEGPATTR